MPSSRQDILIRFGQRLRALREATGLSQEAFADRCQLDRTYISGIERGRRNLSLLNIDRIAKALRVPLKELFQGL
jgi:transcriptional regulator with XRE-family HTH domain